MSAIGPGSTTKFEVTAAISNALLDHTKYMTNLSLWKQFLVWRYTLGSGALNASLVGIAKDDQLVYWVYNFFVSWNYNISKINAFFKRYATFFKEPKIFLTRPDRIDIARNVIKEFIVQLEEVILNAPTINKPFIVYKVSSKYPDLPDTLITNNGFSMHDVVYQKPFNSSTYNPQFNFAPFLAEDATCCIHKIFVAKGSKVLMIPSELHAYPVEQECLFPFGASFDVQRIIEQEFNYIPKELQKFIPVQDTNNLVVGQVYMVDPLSDNKVKRKLMRYYDSIFVNP